MCDRVCVCVIFGLIGLCGTVLLRLDVEVRDGQSLCTPASTTRLFFGV